MSSKIFLSLLQRNFSADDYIAVGINKAFYNKKHGKTFGRDFEQDFKKLRELPRFVLDNRDRYDLYLSFTPLEQINPMKRKKSLARDSYIIAMDIDGVEIPTDLPPSYYWETSPNKWQGVWVLDNLVTPEEQEDINKRLVTKYNFDKTSSDIVHFYRIPSSKNHKYATTFNVSSLQGKGTVYRKKDFIKALSNVALNAPKKPVRALKSGSGIDIKRYDLDSLIERYNAFELYKSFVATTDRSEYSWRIGSHFVRKGASMEEVKFLLLNLPNSMAKWDLLTVDDEVVRLFSKVEQESHQAKLTNISEDGFGKNSFKKVSLLSIGETEAIEKNDDWLIEDVWDNNSVGLIGAPPKSFKSTLVSNLVLSVASGQDFCGKKVKQGGVIMVLGESNSGVEKYKMQNIYGKPLDNLPIYFTQEPITLEEVNDLESLIKDNDIKLLVLDPMYMLIGEDLSKQKEVTHALKLITLLRDRTDCSIMVVHHSKKLERGMAIRPDDLFGTTFINGWYESLILLQRKGSNKSEMKTYFRNHESGQKYTLTIDTGTMKAKMERLGNDDYSDFDSIEGT